ncbi:MAG: hypothetical protein IPL75_09325 [Acidobacteria bacterium]|nr:hypothetical protein [Acidobacteriota bacterium]
MRIVDKHRSKREKRQPRDSLSAGILHVFVKLPDFARLGGHPEVLANLEQAAFRRIEEGLQLLLGGGLNEGQVGLSICAPGLVQSTREAQDGLQLSDELPAIPPESLFACRQAL